MLTICRLALVSLAAGLSGCASDQSTKSAETPVATPNQVLRRLVNTENGLELGKWLVADDSNLVGEAMLRHADDQWLPGDQNERFARNGFRFLRLPLDGLDPLLLDLGGTTLSLRGWHGQVFDWREVASAQVGPGSRAVVIDGRPRRFQAGRFDLLVRCWTMPMEDGPIMHLAMNVAFRRAGAGAFRSLLNDSRPQDDFIASLSLEASLEAGYAYLLTCESPTVDWSEPGDSPTESEEPAPTTEARAASGQPTRRVGPDLGVGPDESGPVPLGRLMLMQPDDIPRRGVLIFVPRIPDSLYPPETTPSLPTPAPTPA